MGDNHKEAGRTEFEENLVSLGHPTARWLLSTVKRCFKHARSENIPVAVTINNIKVFLPISGMEIIQDYESNSEILLIAAVVTPAVVAQILEAKEDEPEPEPNIH